MTTLTYRLTPDLTFDFNLARTVTAGFEAFQETLELLHSLYPDARPEAVPMAGSPETLFEMMEILNGTEFTEDVINVACDCRLTGEDVPEFLWKHVNYDEELLIAVLRKEKGLKAAGRFLDRHEYFGRFDCTLDFADRIVRDEFPEWGDLLSDFLDLEAFGERLLGMNTPNHRPPRLPRRFVCLEVESDGVTYCLHVFER